MHDPFGVCLPPSLQTKNRGGRIPSELELESDCANRVCNGPTFAMAGFTLQGAGDPAGFGSCPSRCGLPDGTCGTGPARVLCNSLVFDRACDFPAGSDCPSVLWDGGFNSPSNIKTATQVNVVRAGCQSPPIFPTVPVCRSSTAQDPPPSVPLGIVSSSFDQAASGVLGSNSSADVTIGTDPTAHLPVRGTIILQGPPCVGSCTVGLDLQLEIDDVTLHGIALSHVRLVGASTPNAATLDASGNGVIAPFQITLGASAIVAGKSIGFVAMNTGNVNVAIDWQARTFSVTDPFLVPGDTDGGRPDIRIGMSLTGTLVNQAPTAVAPTDVRFECTGPAGAAILLDGSGSHDPDNDIMTAAWRTGSNITGQAVATALSATLIQALGSLTYTLAVTDSFGIMATAAETVSVVDTTPPVIDAVPDPSCSWPSDLDDQSMALFRVGHEIRVHATDLCDPNPNVFIKSASLVPVLPVGRDEDSGHDHEKHDGDGGDRHGKDNDEDSGDRQKKHTDGEPDSGTLAVIFGRNSVCLPAVTGDLRGTVQFAITVAATDDAGNETDQTFFVVPPRDADGAGACPAAPVVRANDPACASGILGPTISEQPTKREAHHGCQSADSDPGFVLFAFLLALGIRRLRTS